MPVEVPLLMHRYPPYKTCPKCKKGFKSFMRGEVQSFWRWIFKRPYCAVICENCKNLIDWEKP